MLYYIYLFCVYIVIIFLHVFFIFVFFILLSYVFTKIFLGGLYSWIYRNMLKSFSVMLKKLTYKQVICWKVLLFSRYFKLTLNRQDVVTIICFSFVKQNIANCYIHFLLTFKVWIMLNYFLKIYQGFITLLILVFYIVFD